jgi:hypothetical protein
MIDALLMRLGGSEPFENDANNRFHKFRIVHAGTVSELNGAFNLVDADIHDLSGESIFLVPAAVRSLNSRPVKTRSLLMLP